MLSLKTFKESIELIKKYENRDSQLSDILNTEGFVMYSGELISAIVNLLELGVNDKDKWIQYWLWDCNFGEDATVYLKDGSRVELNTVDDLYNFIRFSNEAE